MTTLRHIEQPSALPPRRRGMTLVEMLVAMAITLLMMGAVAQVFGMFGKGVNGSRSVGELNERMRATAYRLRQDLDGMTVDTSLTPPMPVALNSGYFEVIEGPETDQITYFGAPSVPMFLKSSTTAEPYESATGSDDRLVGDVDDVILLTTRSTGDTFNGRADTRNTNLEGGYLRSPLAEVVWFCRPAPNTTSPRTFTLYRRQRLVIAQPGCEPFVDTRPNAVVANSFGGPPNTLPFTDWPSIYRLTDVSVRRQGNVVVPNTLGDLTRRENRFLHSPDFPHEFPHPIYNFDPMNHTFENNPDRLGEDVILTNVIAFDVRLWDPGAVVQALPASVIEGASAGPSLIAVEPGDAGYIAPGNAGYPAVGARGYGSRGAYVDLAWLARLTNWQAIRDTAQSDFSKPFPVSGQGLFDAYGMCVFNRPGRPPRENVLTYPTYDTWSDFYESNGIDDNGDGIIDSGTNGIDDNSNGIIDEVAEQETSPPYPVSLKPSGSTSFGAGGIQIRLRCYEPSSRQVRQITVLKQL